jgi:hypothetical protein
MEIPMPARPIPRDIKKASVFTRMWNSVFGPRYRPDVLRQSEEKTRTEAEGMIRLGDEGPIADDTVEAVDKLPDHKRRKGKSRTKTS